MWSLLLALASMAREAPCDPLPGWEAVAAAADRKFLIFGETHGTAEAPAAFGEYVCAVSQTGPVLVGIEFSSFTNEAWRRAWAAPHAEFRSTLFEQVPMWGKREDGVASAAMLQMLIRLHALKEAGRDIDLVAFNGAKNDAQRAAFRELPGQEPHEAAQATNIRVAASARPYRHIAILVGGLHAQKSKLELGGVRIRPMAALLDAPERVVSLTMNHAGGESWNCQLRVDVELKPGEAVTSDMLDCGAHKQGPSSEVRDRGFYLGGYLGGGGRADAFNGIFALGPITASPLPAID